MLVEGGTLTRDSIVLELLSLPFVEDGEKGYGRRTCRMDLAIFPNEYAVLAGHVGNDTWRLANF